MIDIDALAARVKAGLDADEAIARAVSVPPDWYQGSEVDDDWATDELLCMWPPEFHTSYEEDKHWRGETISWPENCAHIARWDPTRILRDVAAKRRLLDLLLAEKHGGVWSVDHNRFFHCDAEAGGLCDCGRDERVAAYLGVLAEAYEESP